MIINDKYLHNKEPHLIVGFTERTGLSAANFLSEHDVPFYISDTKPRSELEPVLQKCIRPPKKLYTGTQDISQLKGMKRIILSPGVPRSIALIREAEKCGIPVVNDIELIYPLIKDKTIIGVTGTDGKTTTVTILQTLLSQEKKAVACGNNENPVLRCYKELVKADAVILELSSYMLEKVESFHPNIALITNLAHDHLDRYDSFESYVNAKYNIFKNMTPLDYYIQNCDHPVTSSRHVANVKKITVSTKKKADYYLSDKSFIFENSQFNIEKLSIYGEHNLRNTLMALATAMKAGLSPEGATQGLNKIKPLEHRMQPVPVRRNISVYNDSKATTIQAVFEAVGMVHQNLVLILGGKGKGLNLNDLTDGLIQKYFKSISAIICYGEEGKKIFEKLKNENKFYREDFKNAVKKGWEITPDTGTLLLSPACTSWDQFSSYKERGEVFIDIVQQLDNAFCKS